MKLFPKKESILPFTLQENYTRVITPLDIISFISFTRIESILHIQAMRAENIHAFLVLLLAIMSCDAVMGAPARYVPLQCLFTVRGGFFFP